MKHFLKNFLLVFIVLFLIAGVLGMVKSSQAGAPETVGVAKMVEEINAGQVKKIVVQGDLLKVTLNDAKAKPQEVKKEPQESFGDIMKNYGVSDTARASLQVEVQDESSWKFWAANLIPALLPLILIMAFFLFMSRGLSGMNNKAMGFGNSNPREAKPDDKKQKNF